MGDAQDGLLRRKGDCIGMGREVKDMGPTGLWGG